jgi:hypothetical protein
MPMLFDFTCTFDTRLDFIPIPHFKTFGFKAGYVNNACTLLVLLIFGTAAVTVTVVVVNVN